MLSRLLAVTGALFLIVGARCAQADSWPPPMTEVVASTSAQYRVTIEPSPVDSSLAYYEEKLGEAKGGEAVRRPRPIALFEQKVDGVWMPRGMIELVNEVAPASAIVSDDGAYLVTFDNWYSVGYGDAVVAVYHRETGLVRSFITDDFLPQGYLETLPRSVSSVRWRKEARFSDDGTAAILTIALPEYADLTVAGTANDDADLPQVHIALASGAASRVTAPSWDAAEARAGTVRKLMQASMDERIAYLTEPLLPPEGMTTGEWHAYLTEAVARLAPDPFELWSATKVLLAPDDPRFDHSVEWLIEGFETEVDYPGAMAVASPHSPAALVAALARAANAVPAGSLAASRIYVSIERPAMQAAGAAIARSGAEFIWLDPASPIAQRPERIPGSPEAEAFEEAYVEQYFGDIEAEAEALEATAEAFADMPED